MNTVRVICGDDEGGPYASVSYEGLAEEPSDEVIADLRRATATGFEGIYGEPPKFCVVCVEELDE